jgi:hypothetical protein
MPTTPTATKRPRNDSTVLTAAGGALLLLAGYFLWRDLDLPRTLVLLVGALAASAAAVTGRPRRWPVVGPAALAAVTLSAGAWYLAARLPGLLPTLAVGLGGSALAVARDERRGAPDALGRRLRMYTFGAALLGATWAFYFHFLTTGVAVDSLARRLVPTLAWLGMGLALFLAGRLRATSAATVHTGLALVAVAVTKALAYDTTHLSGGLRVGVLAGAGALLIFAARLRGPRSTPVLTHGAEV